MPLVTVVIPAYNAEKTLHETIESVLHQTLNDIEVVVVDDGSTDRTAAVTAHFGNLVRCISTPNGGVAAARNLGLGASEARYVAFLDSDDQWEPDKLRRQVEILEAQPDAVGCYTGIRRVDDKQGTIGATAGKAYPDLCRALLLLSGVVNVSSAMVRRSVAPEFDPRFSQCADWDYFLRLSNRGRLVAIPDLLVRYRAAPGRMSSNISLLEHDTFAVLDAFFASPLGNPYRHLRRQIYSNHWIILSGSYLHAGRLASSLRSLGAGLAQYPPNARRAAGAPLRWLRRLGAIAPWPVKP